MVGQLPRFGRCRIARNCPSLQIFLRRIVTMFESIHFESTGRKTTNASKPEVLTKLRGIVGGDNVAIEPDRVEPYGADAVKEKFPPEVVVFPESTKQISAILK